MEGSRGNQGFVGIQFAGDTMDFCRFQGLFERHRGQDGRDPLGEHRLAGSRRADHEQVMSAGHCNFNGAFGVFLSLHILKIGEVLIVRVKRLVQIDCMGLQREFHV